MKKVCQELVDFFEDREGWDKDDLLSEYCAEIMKKYDCTGVTDQSLSPDEIDLSWKDELILPLTLQDFADELFDKIIEGVCNVIRTA